MTGSAERSGPRVCPDFIPPNNTSDPLCPQHPVPFWGPLQTMDKPVTVKPEALPLEALSPGAGVPNYFNDKNHLSDLLRPKIFLGLLARPPQGGIF